MTPIQKRNYLPEETYEPEMLVRGHFHGYNSDGKCEDESGQHTTAWVPLTLLLNTSTPSSVQEVVQDFMKQTFKVSVSEFDVECPSERREAPAG